MGISRCRVGWTGEDARRSIVRFLFRSVARPYETRRSFFRLLRWGRHQEEGMSRHASLGADRDIILGVLGGRSNEQWIAQYGSSHQHPVNRVCHTLGIPTILLSVPVFIVSIFFHRLWLYALV